MLGKEWGRPGARLTPEAVAKLERHAWPGNVRQLRHALEGSLALAEKEVLDADDVAFPGPWSGPVRAAEGEEEGATFHARVAAFERRLLEEALLGTRGNKAAAGRALGLDENQMRYLCRKHGLG